jgi:hypothetical protein
MRTFHQTTEPWNCNTIATNVAATNAGKDHIFRAIKLTLIKSREIEKHRIAWLRKQPDAENASTARVPATIFPKKMTMNTRPRCSHR